MTIDEAKRKLDFMKKAYQKLIDEKVDSGKLVGDGVSGEWKAETPLDEAYKSMIDALEIAIKALEQEPCDDCVSRQAVIDTIGNVPDYDDGMVWEALSHAQRDVALLPSVTPQPKVGRWVRMSDLSEDVDDRYKCSKCGNVVHSTDRINLYTFHRWCGRCGSNNDVAKMQEVEE